MKNHIDKKPELLAPAGTLECAITAYEAGADAVYAGLKRFNVCSDGENLSLEDMSKLSAYAKQHGKKFYVAMNAILIESEISKVTKSLSKLSILKPDALIVQDLGLARIARTIMPNVSFHASTQMAIHNSAGVEQAKEMGMERVILSPEITMDELELIAQKSPLELELFIHGSLSSSLAGNSIWPSWAGEEDGRMGSDDQIFRQRFHGKENGKKKSGFFFSMSDMYALDLIPKLSKLGISSFKIEGRLKSADYVKNTVKAYRMMLDATEEDTSKTIREAKDILTTSLGRKWSHGFLSDESLNTLIQHDNLGLSGQLCGNVVQSNDRGFAIEVTRRLKKGDRIRIVSSTGEIANTVTIGKMSVDRKPTVTVRKGERVFIAFNEVVPKGGTVFKVGSAMKDRTAELKNLPLYQQASAIDLDIGVFPNGISVKLLSHPRKPVWNSSVTLEPAQNKFVDEQTLINSFSETGDPKFALGKLSSKIKGELFIPAGTLKKERRAFWLWAAEQLKEYDPKPEGMVRSSEFIKEYKQLEAADASKEKEACLVVAKGNEPKKKHTIVVKSVFECNKKTDEVVLPHFCREDRLGELERRIKEAYNLGIRRFRITALYQLNLLKPYADITKTSSYPLPVSNSMTALELKGYGFSRVQAWLNSDERQVTDLISRSPLPVELYRYGRPFLHATRANVHIEGKIADEDGEEYLVKHNNKVGVNYVYPAAALSIPKLNNAIDFFDLAHAWWGERGTTKFKFKINHDELINE